MVGRNSMKVCTVCVMDTSDTEITFDEQGQCSHCHAFNATKEVLSKSGITSTQIFSDIKRRGEGKEYDCILGLSGGLDSSYLALLAKEHNLKPLVIHVDAGWNSDVAVQNIRRICEYCDFDLHTYVIEWDVMKRAHRAMLKSGLANQDVIQDHIFFATLYKKARLHKIKTVLNGSNHSTEGINVASWQHAAMDASSIKDVFRRFGEGSLDGYQTMSFFEYYFKIPFIDGLNVVNPLNYMNYDKRRAEKELVEKIGFNTYEKKHGESRFTMFFQNHYLPAKFGFDKRKPHLSALILSGQITRDEAIQKLAQQLYSEQDLSRDIEFIASKLDFSIEEIKDFISEPGRSYKEYKNWDSKVRWMKTIKNFINNILGISTKSYH